MVQGISNAGEPGIQRFIDLTGAVRSMGRSPGNVEFEGAPVQVRSGYKNTINQIRAVRYLPVAILDSSTGAWYVVPPDDVIRLVEAKAGGQHGANPYESTTLRRSELAAYRVDTDADLPGAVVVAIAQGAENAALRGVMQRISAATQEATQQSHEWVSAALGH